MTTPMIELFSAGLPVKGQSQTVFNENIVATDSYQVQYLPSAINGAVTYMNEALASVYATATLGDLPDLSGHSDHFFKVSDDGTSVVFRTATEVRSDIGASNAANITVGTLSTDRLPTADQAVAEAGAATNSVMTPLATSQAIAAQALSLLDGKVPVDKSAVRAALTAYVNSTDQPLLVDFVGRSSSSSNGRFVERSLDGTTWTRAAFVSAATSDSFSIVVPPSWSYRIDGGIQSGYTWLEWE